MGFRTVWGMEHSSEAGHWLCVASMERAWQLLWAWGIGGRPGFLVLLAEAAGHAGQVEEGLRLLAEVLAMIGANRREELLAETSRLQDELLLRQAIPDVAQAEAYFYQALAISRRQQAKSWELRAALSLSRLWRRQGKRAEAYALLESVYSWFTEGFDTPDLLDAYALLMELS